MLQYINVRFLLSLHDLEPWCTSSSRSRGQFNKGYSEVLPRLCVQPGYGLSSVSPWHVMKWNRPAPPSRDSPQDSFYLTVHRVFEALPLSSMCSTVYFFTLLLQICEPAQIKLKKNNAAYGVYVVARSRETFLGIKGRAGKLDICHSLKLLCWGERSSVSMCFLNRNTNTPVLSCKLLFIYFMSSDKLHPARGMELRNLFWEISPFTLFLCDFSEILVPL